MIGEVIAERYEVLGVARDAKPADIQSAQNTVASAELSVATAQTNLDYATLRSPSAGIRRSW